MTVSAHTTVCLRTTKASNAMVICSDEGACRTVDDAASPATAGPVPGDAVAFPNEMSGRPVARAGQCGRGSVPDPS
jgi:hypothetical protein